MDRTDVPPARMDDDAFRELTDPFRRELQLHCYRLLGSLQDAEDAVQDALVAAWKGFATFEGRSSVRTWLYRIATNQCLNLRRSTRRRRAKEWDVPHVEPPPPTQLGEVVWLEPYPDALVDSPADPEARYAQRESLALAFVTALQKLPPRQIAVLVLRDVVGFEASETAEILETTVEAANSALKRARAALERSREPASDAPPSETEQGIVDRFVSAWESADLDRLVAMLTDDVFLAMPPIPFEYRGRDLAAAFFDSIFRAGRRFELVPTRANGQPAFGAYLRGAGGAAHGVGLYVLALRGAEIHALVRFESHLLPKFGLPLALTRETVHGSATRGSD